MHRPALATFHRLALAALYALATISSAHAQEQRQKSANAEAVMASTEYKDLVREGMLRYTRGLWDEANAYFRKAHELAPNARTLRGLALVGYDSKHFVQAIDYAEQSLVHPVQPLNDQMKDGLKKLIDQAQSQVARAELITTPADAELRVDGALVARRADGRVWMDPGAHEISVSAPDYTTETRRLELTEQQQARLEVALTSRTAAEPAHIATPAARPRAPARSLLPWVAVGVSAGVAAVGGIMLGIDQANRGEGSGTVMTPLGATLLGVGAVGAVVGITWSLWPRESERATSARLHLSPLAIQCSGTF
jgi:hypothetical protein